MKRITILVLIITILSLQSCTLIENIKWALGAADYGRIEGTVTDTDGNPIIYDAVVQCIYENKTIIAETNTIAEGKYRLDKLEPNEYSVLVLYPDLLSLAGFANVTVEENKTVISDFVYTP